MEIRRGTDVESAEAQGQRGGEWFGFHACVVLGRRLCEILVCITVTRRDGALRAVG